MFDEIRTISAFDAHSLDLLRTPSDVVRVRFTLARDREHLASLLGEHGHSTEVLERFLVRVGSRITLVDADQVDWIGSEGNYLRLHVGQRSHLVRDTRTGVDRRLNPKRFLRIHRSTVVNLSRVRAIESILQGEFVVILTDGTKLNSSSTYRERLEAALLGSRTRPAPGIAASLPEVQFGRYTTVMNRLDPQSPVPLYVQLAEAIRFEIATGGIAPGSLLPALRGAAKRWGVNLHTVRRAYGVLAEKGLVRTDPQRGTVVLGGRSGTGAIDPVDLFVSRVVTEAYERYGLSVAELKLRLDRWGGPAGKSGERAVFVIDRGETESTTLAAQLRSHWAVAAEGWSLDRPGAPPAGLLLAPLQYYSEVRARWPERLGDISFVETVPDPGVVPRILASPRQPARAILCEMEMTSAKGVVADLRRILPAVRVELVPHVVSRAGELLSFVPDSVDSVLFPPRMWDALSATERAHPKAVEIRYTFDRRDLERLAADQGWAVR